MRWIVPLAGCRGRIPGCGEPRGEPWDGGLWPGRAVCAAADNRGGQGGELADVGGIHRRSPELPTLPRTGFLGLDRRLAAPLPRGTVSRGAVLPPEVQTPTLLCCGGGLSVKTCSVKPVRE